MPLSSDYLSALQKILTQEQLLTDPAECLAYGYDNSKRIAIPDAVVFPTTEKHIIEIVQLCNQHHIPIVARGKGTGTPGGSVPTCGGIVISFEKMNRILAVDADNRLMTVEPGVINQSVQDEAKRHGFFWAPDPGSASTCTVGGNLAYNAAGPRAVKYGTCRENTLGLRAVTGDGTLLVTGAKTTKDVVGYDLTRLLIGSEGTLALITQATLKLTPLFTHKTTLRTTYGSIESAADAIKSIMCQPIIPCALEFMDHTALKLLKTQANIELPENAKAMLLIDIDGSEASQEHDTNAILAASNNAGLIDSLQAKTKDESQYLWQARKALSPTLRSLAPNKINEDVVVPISSIPHLIHGIDAIAQQYQTLIVNFGHAGNGNIHVNILFDKNKSNEKNQAEAALKALFELVLKLEGSISGEHGIGLEKKPFIAQAINSNSLMMMKKLKHIFDPNHTLNPDKIFND